MHYAFQRCCVSESHFVGTTGYGYDDAGRDTLDRVFARALQSEDALVRPQFTSGTHAIFTALAGLSEPGEAILSATGKPYDTLEEVVGIAGEPGNGSLRDFGVGYRQVELRPDGGIDVDAVLKNLAPSVKLVLIQRSRGYDWRPSLSVDEIDGAIDAIHNRRPDVCAMVDNCYGEFTDVREPRADLLAGSLIKNPGGGIAPTGGYAAGKRAFVEKVAYRLTSPGVGAEVGSYAGSYRPFYQGLFLAPHATAQAVKTAILAARAFGLLGFEVNPPFDAPRSDIIQAVRFGDADRLIAFCRAVQMCSPVDAEALPEPWEMPGYRNPVIMAAGTFVAGASIELSADAPIRPPYIGYLQGALTYAHGRAGIEGAIALLLERGMVGL